MSAAQIIAENALAGSPQSEWDIDGKASANIQGYAAQFSVNHGETVQFKIDTDADDYRLDIYRMGWYGGLGARKVATVQPSSLQSQPNALYDLETNSADASNWHVSASWAVPTTAVSGVYIAKLTREDGVYGENEIFFVVRNDEGHSDLLFQTSDTTWQAYNTWGGSSLYSPNYPAGRALAVSYSRPLATRDTIPFNYFYASEFPMVRFLERNGYDVSYSSGIDTDRRGAELLEHKVFMSVGHDEYWTGPQRKNVEAARDAGVNLAFFSGNEMFWKTRWDSNLAGTPYTTLVGYKESLANAKIDPVADVWTGLFRDPRFNATTDNGAPENAVTGTIFTVNSNGDLGTTIDVSSSFAGLRFWRNTEVATLTGNQSITLGDRTLGYEWDEDLDNGFRPAGLIPLSSTTRNVALYIYDYGSTYGKGTAVHSMTMYRASSGALVFSAGTIQYSWALDDMHSVYDAATDPDLQQATINLFADMGVQPGKLMAGLVAAVASSDTLAPVSTIVAPAFGAVLPPDSSLTIRGTAQERGGGTIAVVEVSVDGGQTWHRATGRESWTYTFTTRGAGQFTILSRAVDDSGNIETNSPSVVVNPTPTPGVYSLWNNAYAPSVVDANDGDPLELGIRFNSDVNGTITGVRFYKSAANTGTHTAHLWSSTGQLLATATITSETASGWQQANFSTPVAVTAGTTYVASYFAPRGHFSVDRNYFATQGVNNGPLHVLASGPAGGNGVFIYGSNSAFPNLSYQSSNYWVDVVLNTVVNTDNTAPTVDSFAAADGSTTLTTDSAVVIKFSEAINVSTISSDTVQLLNPDPNTIPGGCCSTPGGWCSGCPLQQGANTRVISASLKYDAALHTVTLTPFAPLSTSSIYTVLVHGGVAGVKDMAGNNVSTDTAATFLTPAQPATVASSLWSDTTTPATVDSGEASAVELGMKFTADVSGTISGIRFYKSAANTGVHTGSLWTSSGQLLATATFTSETASGWQYVNFSNPVAITAGSTYVASYHTDSGHFSANRNYFTAPVNNGLLHAPTNAGVYVYGAGGFPSQTIQSSNYWVDVVLRTAPLLDQVAPDIVAFSPATGSTNVARTASATVKFSEAIDPASITAGTVRLLDGGNNFVPTTLAYNAATMTVTLTPGAALAYSTTYTIVVTGGASGVKDAAGNPFEQSVGSSFTTVASPTSDSTPPTVVSVNPTNGALNIAPTSVMSVTFSEAMNAATIDLNKVLLLKNATNRVTASVSYDATNNRVTITPSTPLEDATNYTIYVLGGVVGVQDLNGNAMVDDFVSSFTTAAAAVSSSIWPNTTVPGTVDSGDPAAIEVGVKFTADTSGRITGLRFYKSAANTGTHVGHLWSSTGQLLATATFTNESASGWQQVNFSTPVAVTAGTTYVASYYAPKGHFSVNRNAFTTSLTSGHLTVPASGGVFLYGASSAFPNQSYQASNYWVDVVLASTPPADTTAPTVASTTPAAGAANVAVSTAVTVRFSESMNSATISNSTVKVLDGNSMVTANVAYNSGTNTVTITPTTALDNGKTYTISVVGGFQGVKDSAGNPLAQTFTSTFTTVATSPVDTTAPTVTSTTPANSATNIAVGTSATVTFSEALNAATVSTSTIRLFDGATQVAASVSYNAGNNTVTITPTAALANSKTYTISVLGGASGVKDLAGNALAQTFTSSFTTVGTAPTDTTAPTVTRINPANNATNVAVSATLTITFSEALNAATVNSNTIRLFIGTAQVPATVSYNASNNTVTLTPSAPLGYLKTYTISILGGAGGVTDLAGNALAQTFTSKFTTVSRLRH